MENAVCSVDKNIIKKVKNITYDSRKVKENSIFFALSGSKTDGNVFVEDILKNYNDVYIVSEKKYNDKRCIKVDNARECMGQIASCFYDNPSSHINTVGITGTNGKTTTTYLLNSIFRNSSIIGTTGYKIKDSLYKLNNTTPESIDLHNILCQTEDNKLNYSFMEVSSHAITFNRIAGIDFALKVFTNISQDHLDFYETMEHYAASKISFFKKNDKKVVNIDDKYADKIIDNKNTITYGFSADADIFPLDYSFDVEGIKMDLSVFGKTLHIESKLIGKYNIYNIMCAVGTASYFGKNVEEIEQGIKNCKTVPGRLEFFKYKNRYAVVDYAHTDDAMINVLNALNGIKKNRLIVVFGAGGDRDTTKRPKMGAAADKFADIVFVTSDNPRSENQKMIINDILCGIKRTDNIFVEMEREKAIISALDIAEENDIIAVLGKGHEDYQILNDKTIHFDDREVIKEHWNI